MEAGDLIVITLNNPREHIWGILKKLDSSGVLVRGLDVRNFEEWSRELTRGPKTELGASTVFFPAHRIERINLDERVGSVPSLKERFFDIMEDRPERFLEMLPE